MRTRLFLATLFLSSGAFPQLYLKPVPRVQAVPQPYDQVSFQRDGQEIARYHFSPELNRPFVFPVIGPSGSSLTRMGHPGDPHSHSHHYSVWLSFGKISGVDFWADRGNPPRGRVVHESLDRLDDAEDMAAAVTQANWTTLGGKVLLHETRQVFIRLLGDKEWLLDIHVVLDSGDEEAVFEQGSLGPVGVRMVKTIGAFHGGGVIRNSAGAVSEEQVFRKRARWVDYSGHVDNGVIEGLTLFDHPSNPRHPAHFHVREDGWMGALLTHEAPLIVSPGKPLELRYGVYVHAGAPPVAGIDRQWKRFAAMPLWPPYGPPKTERDCMHGNHMRFNTPTTFRSHKECTAFVQSAK